MIKFDWLGSKGSYLANNDNLGIVTGSLPFTRLEKGNCLILTSGNSITWAINSIDVTNIISYIRGIGTYRVTLNSSNTDVSLTNNIWTFKNSVVSALGVTSVTVTATSGTIYLNRLVLLDGDDEVESLETYFENSSPTEKPIRGFEYPKPTDSSHEEGLVAHYVFSPETVSNGTLLDISGNCLHPNTRLFTNNGWKEAKDLDYGDEIYQSDGVFGEIKNIFISERDEEIIKLKGRVVPEIKLTKEHRVLCIDKDKIKRFRLNNNQLKYINKEEKKFNFEPEWKEAQELSVGDYLVLPKPILKEEEQYLDFFKYTSLTNKIRYYVENNFELNDILEDLKVQRIYKDGKYNTEYRNIVDKKHQLLAGKLIDKQIINKDIKLDKDLAVLFGWYLAEGCTSTDYDICFSLHEDEQKERDEIKRILKEKFNLSSWECNGNGKCITINANSKFLAEFLNEHFDKGARTKQIPNFIKNANKEIIIEFLKAYCSGDGYISKSSDRYPSYISWQSSSNKIIQDLVLVLMKLGIVPTVNRANKEGEKQFLGRTIYNHDSWDVRVTNKDIELFGLKKTAKTEQQYYLEDENNFYIPITKIDTEYYKGEVYDFETETHTLGMPFIIHNSNNGTITGALLTKEGMKFDGVKDKIVIDEISLNKVTLCFKLGDVLGTAINQHNIIGANGGAFEFISVTNGILSWLIGGSWKQFSINNKSNVCVIYDNGTYKLYVNGLLKIEGTEVNQSVQIKGIGWWEQNNQRFFKGEIQDLKIYNYAFTPQQAKDYSNSFIKPVLIEDFSDYPVGEVR